MEPEMTVRKATGWVFVPLNEDGVPLHHGEPMVEFEPGKWMDPTELAILTMVREWWDAEYGQDTPTA